MTQQCSANLSIPFLLLHDTSYSQHNITSSHNILSHLIAFDHMLLQALRDFNREGLPCIIFANWRGFSGMLLCYAILCSLSLWFPTPSSSLPLSSPLSFVIRFFFLLFIPFSYTLLHPTPLNLSPLFPFSRQYYCVNYLHHIAPSYV
jgi:hypothetical protein